MAGWSQATLEHKLASGDLVRNDVFRERVLLLQEYDPDFSLVTVCFRLADNGFPTFVAFKKTRRTGDTSYLQRVLGMKRGAPTVKRGHRYPGGFQKYVEYDLAVALCRALEMDFTDVGV